MTNKDTDVINQRIAELEVEHRDLDDVILRLEEAVYVDQLQLRRLKKRKLQLKDEIARLKSDLIPDLPA
ncbi:MAG: YdcH family protein [Gammaproteobacteria bacterium]|nr:YdcH family protein [Gammaproteobacteria bacterium]